MQLMAETLGSLYYTGYTRYLQLLALSILTCMHLTHLAKGFSSDDPREILHGGQRMAKVQNSIGTLPKIPTDWVGHTNFSI